MEQRTRRLGGLDLGRSTSRREGEFVVQGVLGGRGVVGGPVRNERAAAVQPGVLVPYDRHVLEGPERVKSGEDVLLVHGLGHLMFS
jgi:hypothetical protein